MTASDPRVGEIQARIKRLEYVAEHGSSDSLHAWAAHDLAFLLAELRDRDEKLAKVEGLSAEWEEYPSSPEGRCATQLRAAVAAANGGEG